MTKIIKNVTLASDGPDSWTGERYVELELDCDGKTVFVSVSDIGEDAIYLITRQPVLEYLRQFEEIPEDLIIEKYETGNADMFEDEGEMAESEYYNAFLYMHTLVDIAGDVEKEDTLEYTVNNGDDVDKMNLPQLAAGTPYEDMCWKEKGSDEYDIQSMKIDESTDMFMTAYSAEACIMIQETPVYLEASWASEAPEGISCEYNFESIHNDMIDAENADMEKIDRIRSEGKIYDDLEDAFSSQYGKVFRMLVDEIVEKLAEEGYFEEYWDEDEYPDWYRPTESEEE